MHIVDISEHNGTINFAKLKSKADGAMIRLSLGCRDDGTVYRVDKRALEYVRECERVGLPWGVYHYSYAHDVEDARNEARGVLKLLEGLKEQGQRPLLPIAFDMEDNRDLPNGDHGGASFALCGAMCKAFCELIEGAGYYAQIYASESWFKQMGDLSAFDHWVAKWSKERPSMAHNMWQYTSGGSGQEYGTQGSRIDLNTAYLNYPAIIQDLGLNGFKRPNKEPRKHAAIIDTELAFPAVQQERAFFNVEIQGKRYTFDKNGDLVEGGAKT